MRAISRDAKFLGSDSTSGTEARFLSGYLKLNRNFHHHRSSCWKRKRCSTWKQRLYSSAVSVGVDEGIEFEEQLDESHLTEMHLKRFHHFLISHWMTSRIACSRVLPWRLITKMFAAVEMSGQDLKEPTNFKSQGCVDWFVLCQVGKGYEKWNEVAWNWCNVGFCKASWQPQNCWMSFGVRTDWSGMNPAK